MARRETTGEVRFIGGIWTTRVRLYQRVSLDLPTCADRDEALARSKMLAELGKRFRLASVSELRGIESLRIVAGASARSLRDAMSIAEELLGGKFPAGKGPKALTFEEVGKEWTGGDLHKAFPDHVEAIDQSENKQRLEKAIYPVIGPLEITAITRANCDEVMRRLPEGLSRATRRHYAGLMHRVLNLAELAGYIARNPLPRGWLPKLGGKKRFPILYPGEDRTLLACDRVPLAFRILYGFLHREGVRRGEAAALQWRDLDLENGTISLDENKTDHPRWWRLAPGVTETLERWAAIRGTVEPEEHVFTDQHGRPLQLDHLAETIRAHLKEAGLERADLYSSGPNKGAFGTHSFRRSFVTRSLAIGRNEDWVRQRTGHKSEELLTYRQAAKGLAELSLDELDPLTLGAAVIAPPLPQEIIAPVAELADAQDSGSCARKGVSVRPRPGAPRPLGSSTRPSACSRCSACQCRLPRLTHASDHAVFANRPGCSCSARLAAEAHRDLVFQD